MEMKGYCTVVGEDGVERQVAEVTQLRFGHNGVMLMPLEYFEQLMREEQQKPEPLVFDFAAIELAIAAAWSAKFVMSKDDARAAFDQILAHFRKQEEEQLHRLIYGDPSALKPDGYVTATATADLAHNIQRFEKPVDDTPAVSRKKKTKDRSFHPWKAGWR